MKYTAPSFTVPASGKSVITCDAGHAMPDKWGKCIRCGETVEYYRAELFRVGEMTTLVEATQPPVMATVIDADRDTITVSLGAPCE